MPSSEKARPSQVAVELSIDGDNKVIWLSVVTDEGELEVGIPPVEAYSLAEALFKAVAELGYEGNPSSDPKVAN